MTKTADDSAGGAELELPVGEPVATETAALPRPRTLAGRWVTVRPVDPAGDVDDLFAASHGSPKREALWTYMANAPFASREAMLESLEERSRSTDALFFTVIDNASSKAVGMAAFQRWVPGNRCIEIAHIWYSPEQQRTRTNTETVYLLLEEAFEHLGYRRVEWKCDALNQRSRAAALRLGFQFEGIFRQHMIVRGRNRDTAWYAMVDGDWGSVKRDIERWLSEPELSLTRLTLARQGG